MLKRIWEAWKRIAHKIGNFQARLILTILYVILVLPFGLAVRLFADPLQIRKKPQGWLDRENPSRDMDWAGRQW
jgi:hypothetical protein